MAELAALGVAANIVQFVELGFKVTKSIIETYRNIDSEGLAARHVDLCSIATSLEDRCTQLQSDAGVRADAITMELLRRCIKIASELLSQLESLTIAAGKRDQRWAKFVVSVKANWKKSTIEGLHSRMMDVKTEIFGRLESLIQCVFDLGMYGVLGRANVFGSKTRVSMSASDAMLSLGEASAAWNDATRRRLDAMANDLRDLLRSGSDDQSTRMHSFAEALSKFADESKHQGAIRDILLSLKFTQIKERQNEILQAHKNTFEWLFDESSEANFCAWLENPNEGVFWVTGKPGSGKSTLMKLIFSHNKTVPLAQKWSGSKPLVIASHFFWSVGSQLQRSQEGLLRTILFQILVHCPEVIPEVCSRRYANPFLALDTWSIEELSGAFENLRGLDDLSHRILLLVDGLDEYSGDHQALTVFLGAIARSSNIKVCCASRPWAQFAEAFGRGPWQFEMQRLTRNDMKLFIEDSLGQNPRFRTLQNEQRDSSALLIRTISDKAEGVFFWVSLVVKSILRGLSNQDDFDILQQRLSELPSDLYQFFQRMLDSIEDVYRDKMRLDFVLLLSSSAPLPIDVFRALDVLPSPLEGLEATVGFKRPLSGAKSSIWQIAHMENYSPLASLVELPSRQQKRDQVLARCRDLVQSWQVDGNDSCGIRIGFLHRTVVDFLRESGFLKHFEVQLVHSPRYLLATVLSCCIFTRQDIRERVDFILRFFYCLEEAEPDELRRDGEYFMALYYRLLEFSTGGNSNADVKFEQDDMLSLIAHAMSRLVATQPSLHGLYEKRQHGPNSFEKLFLSRLESYILDGYLSITVGDYATWSRSDLIDLELLDGFIRAQGDDSDIASVWKVFVSGLNDEPRSHPRNVFQACQVLIRHGAQRHISICVNTGPLVGLRAVDVLVDVFRGKAVFDADQVEELAGLFRPATALASEQELYVSPMTRLWKLISGVKGA